MADSIYSELSTDHRRCDDLFSAAENYVHRGDWHSAGTSFQDFLDTTLRHFKVEEIILFPMLEVRTGQTMGPTRIMRSEHEHMRELFGDMKRDIETQDRRHYLGSSETLLTLLQQHNLKEEQVLYPMADKALASEVLELLQRMRGGGLPTP
ncbi:MAG: hemerythrin domain-containing protein [Acidiferrobacterales bacterium]